MLTVRSLRKTYPAPTGPVVALDGIDLDVREGETFGLLGPNGAGKSTLIRCILGITRPDAGEVGLRDVGSPADAAVRRRIGYAPQELALYEEMTAVENLRLFAQLYGTAPGRVAERVAWALDVAGFDRDRARRRVAGYSGGMKRRLNLACAAVHDPDLLLLDEPTVGVDPQSRDHLLTTIESLAASGKTVVYTTHYMEEAERLCDRVAIVDHGRVLACAPVGDLLQEHGGRARIEAELEPKAVDALDDAVLAALGAARGGDALHFEADDVSAAVHDLDRHGVAYRALHVRRADLETVFLGLTGRRLRDA